MLAEQAGTPDFVQGLRSVDIGLGDVRQFATERSAMDGGSAPHETLEMVELATLRSTRVAPISMISISVTGQPPSSVVASRSRRSTGARRFPGIRVLIGFL